MEKTTERQGVPRSNDRLGTAAMSHGACSRERYRTKSEWAYRKLRKWILSGRLMPGQELDQERLAALLKVSRAPLRQALMQLQAEGLIESRPHRTALVAPLPLSDIEDVYATRKALEGMLAEVGVSHATAECFEWWYTAFRSTCMRSRKLRSGRAGS